MKHQIPKYKKEINDLQYSQDAKTEDRVALLAENNLRLVEYVCKKFGNDEDYFQVGSVGLLKAIYSFDTSKNICFATYATRCIRNEILMYLRKQKKNNNCLKFEDIISVDICGNNLCLEDMLGIEDENLLRLEKEEMITALLQELQHLTSTEQYIVAHQYGVFGEEKYTQDKISQKLGISQSYVSRLQKEAIKKLRDRLVGIM